MGKETRLFKSEESKNRTDVGAFLRQLGEKVDTGEVILRQGSDELALLLPPNLILEIQVEDEEKSRGIQHSLEIEIKWFDNGGSDGPVELG
ncbi:MAG: amphi-Trp domain-containing protein [Chloroflexota bacterium]|jgi:amphi-Trp domain-containing protein